MGSYRTAPAQGKRHRPLTVFQHVRPHRESLRAFAFNPPTWS
ncbi:hypothetical protein B1M_35986 [Burkholderia sp. TJI49]|nr:hypothetical protein B1M_35986 [Burkholderia sp. TJI49]